eukprot:2372903-Pleurochrysis_carterae.AAC.1
MCTHCNDASSVGTYCADEESAEATSNACRAGGRARVGYKPSVGSIRLQAHSRGNALRNVATKNRTVKRDRPRTG